ncbi:unnamed protein product [Didymodactylos carnosus]|uniref:Uncharacterized protein n=1 Tax=Didymodactylos carnosus TaxID=1234261 RepID=A0A814LCT2_9BILA|nr:unnamed protein product [Didymodactylos carnosus]CAF1064038.1 unnamed protein product [Didymodactylos carnosus]CAF3696724.1 unnamed protein product [Didymodactylos carnosus]CAF3832032.1 unnamed protein product [Didymodactylos carnosus]
MLAFGYVSWEASLTNESGLKWTPNDYDALCTEIISTQNMVSKHLPLRALLLITSVSDLVVLPSKSIIFNAFNQTLSAAGEYRWYSSYSELRVEISQGLNNLPSTLVNEWAVKFLSISSPPRSVQSISAFCHVLIGAGKQKNSLAAVTWLDHKLTELLWNNLTFDNLTNEFIIDDLLTQIAADNHHLLSSLLQTLKTILSNSSVSVKNMHPAVLPLIIAIYGGLHRYNQMVDEETKSAVMFSPQHIHRDSSLTICFADYFMDEKKISDDLITTMVEHCKKIVNGTTADDC